MKKIFTIAFALLILGTACKEDDGLIFELSSEERAAKAIADLKDELAAPTNGWIVKYRPEDGSGSFYVLLKFDDENNVNVKTDLGARDGKFFEQDITYRIDSSLGLELIFENYSFFSYLFEQNSASFGAEFEFNFVNKTPDDALVFSSKSDLGTPTVFLLEPADANSEDLLGREVAANLATISNDFSNLTPTYSLIYDNKDLILYIGLSEATRTLNIKAASRKTNTNTKVSIDFETPYIIEGDAIVFDETLAGTFVGSTISLSSISFSTLQEGQTDICASPITTHLYTGETNTNDDVVLESTLFDANGSSITQSDFYYCPVEYMFKDGLSQYQAVTGDIAGALAMQLYYFSDFKAIGFVIQNQDESITYALREFTPVFDGNKLVFNFAPNIDIYGEQNTDANINNVNIYLNAIAEGDNTFVFQYSDGIYELYNPCTQWSYAFLDGN